VESARLPCALFTITEMAGPYTLDPALDGSPIFGSAARRPLLCGLRRQKIGRLLRE